ncbi:MAG: hypothetical protein EBU92_09190 [Betaproteobacteria bacterium]|nr:hypothetical protein [Betaproteobacteria bacterium]
MSYKYYLRAVWDSMKSDFRNPVSKACSAATYGKLNAISFLHEDDIEAMSRRNEAFFFVFDYAPRHDLFKY